MKKNYLLESNTKLNEGLFVLATKFSEGNIDTIYKSLLESGLDNNSKGFWIWDIKNNFEIYSPVFRKTLGYRDEIDFPNLPSSWQLIIFKEDLERALMAYEKHVSTRGMEPYKLFVRYNKKYGGSETVLCHGMIVSWNGDEPLIMIGVHLNEHAQYEF